MSSEAAIGVMKFRRSGYVHFLPNGIGRFFVCARMIPLSKLASSSVWSVTPHWSALVMMVYWRGAGPRKLIIWLGHREELGNRPLLG